MAKAAERGSKGDAGDRGDLMDDWDPALEWDLLVLINGGIWRVANDMAFYMAFFELRNKAEQVEYMGEAEER